MTKTLLFLAANPSNRDTLRINDEYRALKAQLRNTEFQVLMQPALQFNDLLDELSTHKPWMVHFSGHGEGASGLLLEDAMGKATHLKSDSLKTMFSLLQGHTHCVFLNACYSEQQAKQISPYIPYIIGMNTQVPDAISLHFSEQLYAGLANNWDIEQAFYLAKTAVRQEHYLDANIPILYKRGQLIEQEPPSSAATLAPKYRNFVDSLFRNYIEKNSSVMLLAQEGFQTRHYAQALRHEAIRRCLSNERVLSFSLPTYENLSEAEYFTELGSACGLENTVNSFMTWRKSLRSLLNQKTKLLLIITRFEKGNDKHRTTLAKEFRSLLEDFPYHFQLVLIGGERLAALKYENGEHSLLNILCDESIPELCIDDIRLLYPHTQALADNVLQDILQFTGQHPVLVDRCLREAMQEIASWKKLLQTRVICTQLFSRFRHNSQLCAYLKQEQLGRCYDIWPDDELLRALYWQNLLMPKGGRLVWRCEWLREMGKELLGC